MSDDRVALRALVDAYAMAVDLRDEARFSALWIEGATLEVHGDGPDRPPTGVRRAPEDLGGVIEHLGRYLHTAHVIGAHSVMVGDDTAVGEATCMAHHLLADEVDPGTAIDRVVSIRYSDRYLRLDGAWRFAHRRVDMLWSEERRVLLPA